MPGLQRFYGGRPVDWLQMPVWLLEYFAQQVERLEAWEALQQAQVAAVGAGNLSADALRRQVRQWQQAARVASGQRPAFKSAADVAAAVGIGYHVEGQDGD